MGFCGAHGRPKRAAGAPPARTQDIAEANARSSHVPSQPGM